MVAMYTLLILYGNRVNGCSCVEKHKFNISESQTTDSKQKRKNLNLLCIIMSLMLGLLFLLNHSLQLVRLSGIRANQVIT